MRMVYQVVDRFLGEKYTRVLAPSVLFILPIKVSFCQIQLPSGAAIKVDASFWGMSVYVRVSEEDHGKTKGLCGNNNGDKSDDMIGSDEVMYAKDPGSIAKKAFIDTWRFAFNLRVFFDILFLSHRVSEKENLFDSSVVEGLEEGGNTDIENNPTINKFCACEGPTKSILSACPNRPIVIQAKAFAGNQWTEVGQDLRSKRAVAGPDDVPTDEDDVDDDYDFVFDPTAEPPVFRFPTPNNITERAAVDECSRVLTASPVAKACIEDGVINTISNDTIASCVEDIKVSCVAIFFLIHVAVKIFVYSCPTTCLLQVLIWIRYCSSARKVWLTTWTTGNPT